MRVAISQSNYIPWRGYFDMISSVDVFVLLDDVQFTRRDWRNRNKIKTPSGIAWLTIPVVSKGKYAASIAEIEVRDDDWREKHLQTLAQFYSRSEHGGEILKWLTETYSGITSSYLHKINRYLIERINNFLLIDTPIISSLDFLTPSDPTERLLAICRELGASTYVTGPAAADYLRQQSFHSAGLDLEWFNYGPYASYRQAWGEYDEKVSIVDVLLNCGAESRNVYRRVLS